MQTALNALLAGGLATGAALRVLRQLVLERLVVLDCQPLGPGRIPLSVVTLAMTELAELALDVAMNSTQQELDALYGPPCCPALTPVAPRCGWWAWASSERASSMSPATST
jgi:glutamate-ammonia-ligase adenylyltransferase